MLFLGMANAYIMRTNMSVAIVAMVNQTALERDPTIPDDECEGYYTPTGNSTVHVSKISSLSKPGPIGLYYKFTFENFILAFVL